MAATYKLNDILVLFRNVKGNKKTTTNIITSIFNIPFIGFLIIQFEFITNNLKK